MNILIVDDSALLRSILRQVIGDHSDISIVGEATNGLQALEMNKSLEPDLVIMDIDMPVMDGVTAVGEMMKHNPVPILILSSILDANNGFRAMKNGALEVMKKPDIDQFNDPSFYQDFLRKIRALADVPIRVKRPSSSHPGTDPRDVPDIRMIVMGASTGGPVTVSYILSRLPADYPIGIALVQHLESSFDRSFARWLDSETKLKVRLAGDGDVPSPGEILVAPSEYHLAVRGGRLVLDDAPPILNQKPSVNLLFTTAAECYHRHLAGVLLTGMGVDGAEGCLEIKKRGGLTLVQDESTSTVFGMPRSAIERGGATAVLTDEGIARYLMKLAGRP